MSEEVEMQEVGCSTPTDSTLCKNCKRNTPEHEEYIEFKVEKKIMQADECSGYINKSQGSLF